MSERYFESLNAEALASLASMEGLDAPAATPVAVHHAPPETQKAAAPAWIGYAVSAAVATAAYAVHLFYKPVSAAILAILLGALLRNLGLVPVSLLEGCRGVLKRVIPITIVITGATLNLTDLARGLPYLAIVVLSVAFGSLGAVALGRLFGASRRTALLVGAGTAICGNSAVVAVAPVIRAEDDDILLSVSTINIVGLSIMFFLPIVGAASGMSQESFGVWAGAVVHAVPQSVATGFAFGPLAGSLAALVKLVRVSLLAPFVLLVAFLTPRDHRAGPVKLMSLLPPFLLGFAALAAVNTLGLLPDLTFHPVGVDGPAGLTAQALFSNAGNMLLTLSMAAMGLEVSFRHLIRTGGPALLTGVAASLLQCVATWLLIRMLL